MIETKCHARHRSFHAFDRIDMGVVTRYKTSGMSGDEWRISVVAKFYFKGEVVHEESFHDMKSALMMLPSRWICAQEPIPMRVIELEEKKCDQPGCPCDAEIVYRLKKKYSDRGELLDQTDGLAAWEQTRQFCGVHARRGDCALEDADSNYEVVSGCGPDGSRNVTESPSHVAAVIEVGSCGEIPGAVADAMGSQK